VIMFTYKVALIHMTKNSSDMEISSMTINCPNAFVYRNIF